MKYKDLGRHPFMGIYGERCGQTIVNVRTRVRHVCYEKRGHSSQHVCRRARVGTGLGCGYRWSDTLGEGPDR